eukprot:255210-Hanusia_phi.AAC.1
MCTIGLFCHDSSAPQQTFQEIYAVFAAKFFELITCESGRDFCKMRMIRLYSLIALLSTCSSAFPTRTLKQLPIIPGLDHFPETIMKQSSGNITSIQIRNPICFGKESVLVGMFCVGATTDEQEKDPDHLLPRLSLQISRHEAAPPLTVFFFDDERNSWDLFWKKNMMGRSCEEIHAAAKATITENSQHAPQIDAYKNIQGKFSHTWYVVAVDCQNRKCPTVDSINVTFFHPNTDGGTGACSGLIDPMSAMEEAFVESWKAMELRNIMHVVGVSPFGVFLLYLNFTVMLVCSLLFLM